MQHNLMQFVFDLNQRLFQNEHLIHFLNLNVMKFYELKVD